ncbi:MAG: SRPBCC family protein [Rubrobacteraceae bacterium]
MTERGSVRIKERIEAPAPSVAAYIGDFRHAKEWMVGVESVEQLGEDRYRLEIETPVGRIKPEVEMQEHNSERISWIYTSAVEGGGLVEVVPAGNGSCVVSYSGDFQLKQRLLGRLAKAVGAGFARRNGERSLERLKYLMEAHRY